MQKNAGVRAVGAQRVREILGGTWMRVFVALTVCEFALAFGMRMLSGASPVSFIVYTMAEGFVTAEVLILYQRKESRNLRHLSVYSAVMAVVMLTVFVGLTVLAITMAASKDSLPEDMLEEWTRDFADNFPKMIFSTVLTGVTGAQYIFLRLALKQGADLMDRKKADRDWRMPAAALTIAVAVLSAAEEAMGPFNWLTAGMELVGFLRSITLAALLWPGADRV